MTLFRQNSIHLGTYGVWPGGFWPLGRSLGLPRERAGSHWWVTGVSESGKSRFLAHLCLSYLKLGLPVTLIDPHGDLARLVLMLLIAEGVYTREEAYERILYLDLPAAERAG